MSSDAFNTQGRFFQIPCGHCIGCRTAQSKEWSNRLLMESLYHDKCYFITLTYCPEFAFWVDSYDPDTGEYMDRQSLYKPDVQNFFKRLRRKKEFRGSKFRYFVAGEYGPASGIAHYHMVLFCDFLEGQDFDLVPSGSRNEAGQLQYNSKILDSLWCNTDERSVITGRRGYNKAAVDKGRDPQLLGWTDIAPANYYTMRYVAGYIQKKLGAYPNEFYERLKLVPPFSLSSRRPGIGLQYLLDHPEIMEDDKVYIGQPQGVVEFMPPRYFRKKLKDYNFDLALELSDAHMLASEARLKALLSQTDLSEDDYNNMLCDLRLTKSKLRNKI